MNGDCTVVIILGLGFTGQRLARRLLRRGDCADAVFAAVRGIGRFEDLAAAGLRLAELAPGRTDPVLPKNAVIALLIPPLPKPESAALRALIQELEPRRVVYVSSTAVYGDRTDVDEETPAEPQDERGRQRLEEEQWIAAGPWTSLSLRAAGIYGPWRGVHAAVRAGKMPRSAGSGIVSRIHVEDLAAIMEAGIFSDLEGAWPVADDEPCSSAEIAAWCSRLWKLPETGNFVQTGGRKVNGRKILAKLGVEPAYPSWRTGVPASLEEEGRA
jgi:uncharacterized protein YbjT (DUF2867 family)